MFGETYLHMNGLYHFISSLLLYAATEGQVVVAFIVQTPQLHYRQHIQQMVLAWVELACRRIQADPFLSLRTKLKSKWIKNLHIKPDKFGECKVKEEEEEGEGEGEEGEEEEDKEGGWRDASAVKSTALPEVLSSIPGNHMVAHNHL